MRPTCLLAALLGLAALPSFAAADAVIVSGSASAGWQAFPTLTPGSFGNPFWNGKSTDSSDGNASVGYALTGKGDFASGGALAGQGLNPALNPANLSYWGFSNGNFDTKEKLSVGGSTGADYLLHFAANFGTNVVGWYDKNGLHPLLSSGGPTTVMFQPTGAFGFYVQTAQYGDFFSDPSLIPAGMTNGDPGNQHFALFKDNSTGTLYVGVEDLPFLYQSGSPLSDRDYNDAIFSVTAVPEPASLTALGLGGVLLGALGWYRRRQPM